MSYHPVTLRICLLFLSLTIGPLVNSRSTRDRRNSGIYIDNDRHRRMTNDSLTTIGARLLQREILEDLELPDRPNIMNGRARSINGSATNYLMNLYANMGVNESMEIKNNSKISRNFVPIHLSATDLRMIRQSDSIAAFSAWRNHKRAPPKTVKRMWFNVNARPKDERLILAELRLYRRADAKNHKNDGSFTITVYRVVRTGTRERKLQSVDSINTTAGQQGWITLNVTESMDYWMKNPNDNIGLHLSVYPIDCPTCQRSPGNIGIVGFKDDAEHHPFMAAYYKRIRQSQSRMNRGPKLDNINVNLNKMRKRETSGFKGSGQIGPLYVNFKNLGRNDWIIAPEGYYAYYCDGECSFPITRNMNITNHAVVQILQHLLDSSNVPKPCCTPGQLKGISVLYFLDDGAVALKKFEDMIV